jgi:hypothetical protein
MRIIRFIARYIRHAPWYVFVYPFFYFARRGVFHVRFFSQQELTSALKRGRSLIRFGDGEINFLIGRGNPYQAYDTRIERMLRTIIAAYTVDSPFILGVSQPIVLPNWELKQIGRFKVWQPFKVLFTHLFPRDVGYADTHQFYYDHFFEAIIAPIFATRRMVLITKSSTIEKQRQNAALPWKDFYSVVTPDGDAVLSYAALKKDIEHTLVGLTKEDTVLFFAVGPVGKYLMFEFVRDGWQCLDIGKRAEVMFTDESVEYLI